MSMYRVFALVGPAGAGKTTLLLALIETFPQAFKVLPSWTSRAYKEPADALCYQLVTRAIIEHFTPNEVIDRIDHGGNLYTTLRREADDILTEANAILTLTEEGVSQFRTAGYEVVGIRIIPQGGQRSADPVRAAADIAQSRRSIGIQHSILNSFAPGGRMKATQDIVAFITGCIDHN